MGANKMGQDKRIEMEKVINSEYPNIAGMVVLKKGKVVYEKYGNGYLEDDTVHIASATKSIFSILIGIAVDEGYIKSVDQKILEFFPDYEIKENDNFIKHITIKHMLTMTAPYKCETEPYKEVLLSNNWIKPALDLLGGKEPSDEFTYSPMIGTHILSGILAKAVGRSILDFATEKLFLPLNMHTLHNVTLRKM